MIQLNALGFEYGKRNAVFSGLSLDIPQGRSVGILGANGVGKTTLIKLLAGAVSPSNGSLSVMGHTPRARELAFYQELFVVPEESDLPPATGHAFVRDFSVFYPRFDHPQFAQLCEKFSLAADKKLTQMSLGQRKKFLLAFALATGCQLILMDEPTNGLDIPAKAQFRDMIIQHQSDEQTVLICTHQVRDLESIIDSVVMMNEQHAHWFDLAQVPDYIAQVSQIDETHNVLYQEKRMGMDLAIVAGANERATDIDLELLFNTFHTNYQGLITALQEPAR